MNISNLKFNNSNLIPAIIQDFNTNEILMLGYMNKESILLTIESKTVWFFSRSRNKLWNKGETSGNFLNLVEITADCDYDTLLIKAIPKGPTCHTGKNSCFFNTFSSIEVNGETKKTNSPKLEYLQILYNLINDRKINPKNNSYTNYLFDKGIDKILKKIGEEASEVIIASKNNKKSEIVYETSDFLYHLLVLLNYFEINLEDIINELISRK